MDKLKSFLVGHGEKLLAAVCALFGFLALSSAHWSADNRAPMELEAISQQKQSAIDQNVWPDEEKLVFKQIEDVRALTAVEAKHKIDPAKFQIAAINPSLIRSREKRSRVDIVAPTRPVADPIVVTIAMPPLDETEDDVDGEDGATTDDDGEAKDKEEMTEDELIEEMMRQKYGFKSPAVAGMGAGGAYEGGDIGYTGGEEGMGAGYMGEDMAAGYMGEGGGYEGGGYEGGMDLYSEYGGSAMMAEKTRVRVSAGVSVRMTVNLQDQRASLRKALHLGPGYDEAQREILYTDLLVQRRQKHADGSGWAEWEELSSEDLGEILEDSLGIDRDIVNPGVTRNTITMPLPRRAAGEWTPDIASHPDLENFVLSETEKAMIDKWNQMAMERIEEEKKDAPIVVEPKGFSAFVTSAADMSSMYGAGAYGSESQGGGYEDEMYNDYESGMEEGQSLSARDKEILDATSATAEKRLLLVRFMDFTVERGYTYQYRVRLEMKNPNYLSPLDELEDPSIGTEPTLLSEWSKETPEAFVPEAHRMYVADVESRRGRTEKVRMSVFTDTTETGMPMLGKVTVYTGMPIGGTVKQEVVDLTVKAVEERDVVISTGAVLAGAEEMMRLSSSDHPELKGVLSQLDRGATLIPSQVTIVDNDGGIKLRAIGDDSRNEKSDMAESEYILKTYSDAWKSGPAANDFFGDMEGGAGYEGGGMYGMSEGSSAAGGYFGGAGTTGKRMSSRAKARAKREAKKNGTFMPGGPGGAGGSYE